MKAIRILFVLTGLLVNSSSVLCADLPKAKKINLAALVPMKQAGQFI